MSRKDGEMEKAIRLLQQLEWCVTVDFGEFTLPSCPVCGGISKSVQHVRLSTTREYKGTVTVQSAGHAPSCELAEILRESIEGDISELQEQIRNVQAFIEPGYPPPVRFSHDFRSARFECLQEVAKKELANLKAQLLIKKVAIDDNQ